jgi:midasin
MESLQIYRSQTNLFSGKNSVITVRDLLKWACRIVGVHAESTSMEDVAREGYFVLAERSRTPEDKAFIKETISKVFNVIIDEQAYYE